MGWSEIRGPVGREVPNPPWLGGALTTSIDFLASLIYIRSERQVGLGKPSISFVLVLVPPPTHSPAFLNR